MDKPISVFRRAGRPLARLGGLLLTASAFGHVAYAQTATCEERDNALPGTLTLAYEGPDSGGTLNVRGSFGTLKLAASGGYPDTPDATGKPSKGFGIRASGSAPMLMPDKAALETCMRSKLKPGEDKDDDLVLMSAMSCRSTTSVGAAPLPVQITVEFASTGPDMVYVYVQRTYEEPSTVGGKKLVIESVPPPLCRLGS